MNAILEAKRHRTTFTSLTLMYIMYTMLETVRAQAPANLEEAMEMRTIIVQIMQRSVRFYIPVNISLNI